MPEVDNTQPQSIFMRPLLKSIMRAVHYDSADAKFEWKFYLDRKGQATGIAGEVARLDDGWQWITIVSTVDDPGRKERLRGDWVVEEMDVEVLKRILHTRHEIDPKQTSSTLINVVIDRLSTEGFTPHLVTNKTAESPKTPSFVFLERGAQVIMLYRLKSSTAAMHHYNSNLDNNHHSPEDQFNEKTSLLDRVFSWLR